MGPVGFSQFDGVHAPPSANVKVVSTFLARTDATLLGDSVARENQSEIGRRSVCRIESNSKSSSCLHLSLFFSEWKGTLLSKPTSFTILDLPDNPQKSGPQGEGGRRGCSFWLTFFFGLVQGFSVVSSFFCGFFSIF